MEAAAGVPGNSERAEVVSERLLRVHRGACHRGAEFTAGMRQRGIKTFPPQPARRSSHFLNNVFRITLDPVQLELQVLGVTVVERPGHGQDMSNACVLQAPVSIDIKGI